MSITFMPMRDSTGHVAMPKTGTYMREKDEGPASLLLAESYPLRAVCTICGAQIRLERPTQPEWEHAAGKAAAPVSPAGDAA